VTHPSIVRALVTMSAGGDRPSQEAQDRIARFGLLLRDGTDDERREAVRVHQRNAHAKGWVDANPLSAMLERQLILSYDRQAMPHVTRLQPDAAPVDMERRFGDIGCPTLIVWGEEDVRAEWGPRMKEAIRGSQLLMVPGAGHQVTADAPSRVTSMLVEFIDSVHAANAPAAAGVSL
jgi:pimeloyl-ACP methyl ester carboxylesterase